MFGMGMTEILVILVIAMIFLGPEKLPEAAAKISKGIREIRKQSRELQSTIETDTEIGGAIRDLKSALRGDELRRPVMPAVKKEVVPTLDVPVVTDPVITETVATSAVTATVAVTDVVAGAETSAVTERATVTETAEPAAEADLDPDDPLRLIRPATGTAKREHG